MARITVEDCLEQVENRFHLVRVASKRARQLMNGKEPTLDWDNDKATVLALREVAAGNITEEMLIDKAVVNEDEGIFDQSEIDAEIGVLLNTDNAESNVNQGEIDSGSQTDTNEVSMSSENIIIEENILTGSAETTETTEATEATETTETTETTEATETT